MNPGTGPTVVRVAGLACGEAVSGTGFLTAGSETGLVLTNAHVVAGAEELSVSGPFGVTRTAKVAAFDPRADLALLAVAGHPTGWEAAEFGDAAGGDVGSVADSSYEVRRRIRANIADIYGEEVGVRLSLEIAADIAEGDSGSPLVASDGSVVGMVYAASRGKDGTAYAIRGPEIERFLAAPDSAGLDGECR